MCATSSRVCSRLGVDNEHGNTWAGIDLMHLVAQGSLDELRAGVRARLAQGDHGTEPSGHGPEATLTLEQIFLSVVGSEDQPQHSESELAWLS